MSFRSFLLRVLLILAPVALLCNLYTLSYPAFHRCGFAQDGKDPAPFRLLTFGDPQLEGDTSLPKKPEFKPLNSQILATSFRERDVISIREHVLDFGDSLAALVLYYLQYAQKQVDLFGNDYYLAHIYRTLHWYTKPTHVTVLGDLLGSQWITDEEFEKRSWRYWNRVFKGSKKVPTAKLVANDTSAVNEEVLGEDNSWSRLILNPPGNHDIGYAGDIDENRVERFEREFGPVNGQIRFSLPVENSTLYEQSPTLRLVILNTMNLDTPQRSEELSGDTVSFINNVMNGGRHVGDASEALILLTHIPLHKEGGICADEPFFSYFPEDYGGGVKEQNFLKYDTGRDAILQGIYGMHTNPEAPALGMGRPGIILTGHDHEGCDVYHYADRETWQWSARRMDNETTAALVTDMQLPGIREVTVRSMMGEFGGNAALVSAWWNLSTQQWHIEVRNCGFGVQHVWWAVHVLDIVTLALALIVSVAYLFAGRSEISGGRASTDAKKKTAAGRVKGAQSSHGSGTKQNRKPVEDTARRKATS